MAFKKVVRFFLDINLFFYGCFYYWIFHKTPPKSYLAMIRLHCLSGGRMTDFFVFCLSKMRKKIEFDKLNLPEVFLSGRTEMEVSGIVEKIQENGYYIFDEKMPSKIMDHLYNIAMTSPCDLDDINTKRNKREFFDSKNPKASRYNVPTEVLLNDAIVQSIFLDKTLLNIASGYLKSLPILDICALWLSPAWAKEASVEAAQKYHFDMDRLKWIKFFVYLVDVDEKNGPHVFVKGTHKYDKRQNHLLKGGYVRLEDAEVENVFLDQVVKITGKRGTMFLADTRALHKGLLPSFGYRVAFQLEFTSSLFGGFYKKYENIHLKDEKLKEVFNSYPKIFPLIG